MLLKTVFLIFVEVLALFSVANSQDEDSELPCKEPRPLACPELVCKLKNSRKTDFCKDIECEGITVEKCNEVNSTYVKDLTMCGCCPGCAIYNGVGEACGSRIPSLNFDCKDPICPILMNYCNPELDCNYLGGSSKVCVERDPTDPGNNPGDSVTCEGKRALGLIGALHWTPSCDEDGKYSAKQCKKQHTGDGGFCFCSDPEGNRIFGREWYYKSQNQTCACSRQVHNLRNPQDGSQGKIAAIHCSYDGNYEPLQCDMDSGLCYCVFPQTGELTGAVLPEHKWKELPCYSTNLTNGDPSGEYLRICESAWVASERVSREADLHGLKVYSGVDYECAYDGTFGNKLRIGELEYCVNKVGSENSGYFQGIDTRPMNCQCYRDTLLHQEEGINFAHKTCQGSTGNYPPTSISDHTPGNEKHMCVDEDGIFYGDSVDGKFECCLLGNCPEDIEKECSDQGIRHCCSFPGMNCLVSNNVANAVIESPLS